MVERRQNDDAVHAAVGKVDDVVVDNHERHVLGRRMPVIVDVGDRHLELLPCAALESLGDLAATATEVEYGSRL